MPATTQFDFLTDYVVALLEDNGLADLSEEQKKMYVPLILAQLEERIGLVLLPKLSESNREKFVALANNQETTAQEWDTFWHGAVPDFEAQMQTILLAFGNEVKQVIAGG